MNADASKRRTTLKRNLVQRKVTRNRFLLSTTIKEREIGSWFLFGFITKRVRHAHANEKTRQKTSSVDFIQQENEN